MPLQYTSADLEETAEALNVSTDTVGRDWRAGKGVADTRVEAMTLERWHQVEQIYQAALDRDLTERSKSLERGRDAEHANRLKDEFLAMVSHELRTPLNAVLGWADILHRGDIDRTKRGRALNAIYTNAARQVQLIDELLDVSRIISGKLRLERAAIDLALGLGLSIVKHLVEAHGGTVSAESAGESQGSTFIVQLPTVAVMADEKDADIATSGAELPVPLQPVPGCLEAISVLVVDDDADGRELVAAALEHYGAGVMTAASAAEALDLLQTKPVNVLLADIAMPDEDGYSLIRRLRALQSPQCAAIPAAALTSFARDEDRQHAIQAGFQLHLAKPIDSRSLVQAVVNLAQGIQT